MPEPGQREPVAAPSPRPSASRLAPDLDSALRRLVERRRFGKGEVYVPVSDDEVRVVFERLGSVATSDVLAFYAAFGAGGVGGLGDPLIEVWALDAVAKQEPSDRGVLFADFLISSHAFRLCPIDDAHSAVCVDHGGDMPLLVGLTLDAFLISLEADEEFGYDFN